MDTVGNFALQMAAKPLQMATTWLPFTAYRNLPSPYPMVPLAPPTMHRFATVHMLQMTD